MTPGAWNWSTVLAKLAPYGISMEWRDPEGGKFGCYLVRIENYKRKTYPIDLSPNHNLDTVTVPPSQRASICRRYKLDLSVLGADFDESE
jgi:hypothetical protein